jgi:hypothetical protein
VHPILSGGVGIYFANFVYSLSVSLTGGSKERTAAFVKELHRAASIIQDIVKASA